MERLLTAIREPLFHHIMGIVREHATAEDVLQDTLYTICRKVSSLRDPRWFRAWCYRIATRAAVRRSKAERFWLLADRDESLTGLASQDSVEHVDLTPEEAISAIRALSPASQLVLRMHYVDGLSYREVAEALELSPGTVKSRVAYGLATLRAGYARR